MPPGETPDNDWVLDSASLPMLRLLRDKRNALMSLDDNSGEPWPRMDTVDGGVLGSDPVFAEKMSRVLNL